MSRSLGDKIAHSVGVSSLPEVKSTFLGVDDKFIVIGSDGVWEFLSNEQIAEIVLPFYQMNQPEAAANAIVKEAYKAWRENEEVVDDITTVVIFVEPYMAYRQVDLESKLEKNVDKGARNHFVQKSNSQPNVAAAGLSK
jgi:serine/threonine protein phosphatase PrpC